MGKLTLLIFLSTLFTLNGCFRNTSDYERQGDKIVIIPNDSYIKNIKEVPWRVGPSLKQRVSRGILLEVRFPLLGTSDFNDILDNSEINSWLIRVMHESTANKVELGKVYIPLSKEVRRGAKTVSRKQNEKGFIEIVYSAVYPSPRFAKFNCPAFGHDLKISETEIIKNNSELQKIITGPVASKIIVGKVHEFGMAPTVLNGGTKLEGRYYVEIALYNYHKKKKVSNYLKLSTMAIVSDEQQNVIKGCRGFTIPVKDDRKKGRFNWNRN